MEEVAQGVSGLTGKQEGERHSKDKEESVQKP